MMTRDLPDLIFDEERLEELRRTGLLEEESIENFDRLTRRAVEAVGADAGYVSLLSEEKQYLRGCVGLPEPLATQRETPLEESLCAYALGRSEPLALEDVASVPGFEEHPAVEELGIRSYLGAPLITDAGETVGTLCVVGWEARRWSGDDVEAVRDFAAFARTEVQVRRELGRCRRYESEIREREAAFRALVENVTDVVTVLDRDGTIVFESPSVEEALGYEQDELVGQSVLEFLHEGDRERVREAIASVLAERGRRETVEVRFRAAGGSWRILEAAARSLPEDSELGAILTSSRDVTERRELEETLRLLATAVKNAETGVVITGPDLEAPGPEIQYVNDAMTRITGYDEGELVGATPRMLQGPETDREVLERLKEKLTAGNSFEGQTVNYRKDGTPYHVRWKVTPIVGDAGEVTHYVSVQEDVTEQVKREELLEARVRERTRELDRSQSEALARLARAAEYRDDETGRHTQRVGERSAVLARSLGEEERRVTRIREAAPLHDIGKIGVADQILRKPGPLSDEEYRVMKLHAEIGADLLSGGRSELFRMAERIARHHHEQWDGGGYPDGLEGEEIPLAARIVGVADAFDAMTHDRPYRDALPLEQALAELREGAGSQFDPRVVEAMLTMAGD